MRWRGRWSTDDNTLSFHQRDLRSGDAGGTEGEELRLASPYGKG